MSITATGGRGAARSTLLPRKVARLVIAETFHVYGASHLGGRLPAFDGVKNLFTAAPLPGQSFDFEVSVPDDRPPRENAPP